MKGNKVSCRADLWYNIIRKYGDGRAVTLTPPAVMKGCYPSMMDIVPVAYRTCPRCKTKKPASDFDKSHTSKSGLQTYCKPCRWQWQNRLKDKYPEGHKQCTYCREIKSFAEFFHDRNTRDGYGYECKSCHKERQDRFVESLEECERTRKNKKRSVESLPEGHKRCLICEEIKSFDAFYKRPKNSDGLYSYCKECEQNRKRKSVTPIPETRRCTRCEEVKPSIDFYMKKTGKNKGSLRSTCKECDKITALQRQNEARLQPYGAIKSRNVFLRSAYGINLDEYNRMLQEQGGKCASCGYPETTVMRGKVVPLAVDHCHTTGAVRGLLCRRCNQALGMLCEDPERVENLLKYIHERVLW